ncbi:MAG: RNA methyltransferase [Candidatus Zixiibacteriota bacterium]|nr:MAG: RNA methyltransferase [candidate division Zixibacteria bacterium]
MSITKNELKGLKALLTKKGRREAGMFSAEGVRLLEEALRHGFLPQKVYYARSLAGERGERLLAGLAKKGVARAAVAGRELEAMSDTETPQGLVGVFRIPETKLRELYIPRFRRVLWCENIADPGNLGTMVRSALAFGFEPVVISGDSADVFAPKVVRSSAGAIFGLRVARETPAAVLRFAAGNGLKVVATGPLGKKLDPAAKKVLKREKFIMVVGSEAHGVSPQILDAADMTVRVSHSTKVESLNAAMAGSILMSMIYNLDRGRP